MLHTVNAMKNTINVQIIWNQTELQNTIEQRNLSTITPIK